MPDIAEMTLTEIKGQLARRSCALFKRDPPPAMQGSGVVMSLYRHHDWLKAIYTTIAETELDAARAAYRWLIEQEGK